MVQEKAETPKDVERADMVFACAVYSIMTLPVVSFHFISSYGVVCSTNYIL